MHLKLSDNCPRPQKHKSFYIMCFSFAIFHSFIWSGNRSLLLHHKGQFYIGTNNRFHSGVISLPSLYFVFVLIDHLFQMIGSVAAVGLINKGSRKHFFFPILIFIMDNIIVREKRSLLSFFLCTHTLINRHTGTHNFRTWQGAEGTSTHTRRSYPFKQSMVKNEGKRMPEGKLIFLPSTIFKFLYSSTIIFYSSKSTVSF